MDDDGRRRQRLVYQLQRELATTPPRCWWIRQDALDQRKRVIVQDHPAGTGALGHDPQL